MGSRSCERLCFAGERFEHRHELRDDEQLVQPLVTFTSFRVRPVFFVVTYA